MPAMKLSEDQILALVGEYFPPTNNPTVLLDRGDDCAVLAFSSPIALTSDIFAENAHFRRCHFSPFDIGYKALAVNISDLAAQGATPCGFSVCLTLTGAENEAWIRAFLAGMASLTHSLHGLGIPLALTGGDLTRAALLSISITAWGTLPPNSTGLMRRQAKPGDSLFLIGPIGLSHLALTLLEESLPPSFPPHSPASYYSLGTPSPASSPLPSIPPSLSAYPAALAHHLRPMPCVQDGLLLTTLASQSSSPFSLMDVSDGLHRDLPRLLGASMGADLHIPSSSLHPELLAFAAQRNLSPEQAVLFAYEGGEDYALLGSCPTSFTPTLLAAIPHAQLIGTVTPSPTISLNAAPLPTGGFDHFG